MQYETIKEKNTMETIYQKIEKAVKAAAIKGITYKRYYPRDFVVLDKELTKDETADTLTPMLKAMEVIMGTIKKEATPEDDITVEFTHIPFDEIWKISIGDGR